MCSNLFVYIDGVKSPLVVLQDGRGGHRLIVLGADDDDDEIALLCEGHITRITTHAPRMLRFTSVWRFHLAEEALHEVDLADAPQLLLKNVNLETNEGAGQKTVDRGPSYIIKKQKKQHICIHACQSRCVGAEQQS